MKWKTDSEVAVITQNFTRRCGTRTENEDWNIYWANAATVKGIFHPESGQRLGDAQLINHYPNHYELTRKDLMVKNIKRYLRDASRDATADLPPDFVPVTYMLPADYSLFVEAAPASPRWPRSRAPRRPTARSSGAAPSAATTGAPAAGSPTLVAPTRRRP